MTREQAEALRQIAHAAIKRDPFGCAYCRGKHDTDAELETCAAAFWKRHDEAQAFDRGVADATGDDTDLDCATDGEFAKEAEREAFE